VLVICLFRDFRVGLEDVSRSIISWRLPETVNSSGMDMFAIVDGAVLGCFVCLCGIWWEF
jgi:hypothetical protein